MVPHITDAIKNWIESVAAIPVDEKEGPADVCVIELGGTVGKKILLIPILLHLVFNFSFTCFFPFLTNPFIFFR